MPQQFLYEQLDSVSKMGFLKKKISNFVTENLNKNFELREYQKEAFARFFHCYNGDFEGKGYPLHLLFNMATGSGKTLIMAGLILYLYEQGYRNFLFFVNSTNIIKKTEDNFLNSVSSKYLFNNKIVFNGKQVYVKQVDNFEGISNKDINICFTTIQKLHSDLYNEKENSITPEDFKSKKIVFISDEAHHGQVQTRNGELFGKPNWENTVENIFKKNSQNLLLEFTATMDLSHQEINEKYKSKIIYKYDLKEFRKDRFSKEIELLHTDTNRKDRIIQALILNQYRQEVAGKYGINLKPVILFKAQKTIEQSEDNKKLFHKIIDELLVKDIGKIKKTNVEVLQRAFKFFSESKITDVILVKKLKDGFSENKTLSVNEENEKEKYQLLINSLEDKNNQIRAIFAVQKLNEGWDVLNLFDIVRLYETRDGKDNKPGKTTISEAQLIGRGARYFPFKINETDEKFKRKFDNLDSELKILEELHYHSHNESRYISEIRTALIKEGMLDENQVEVELKLKDIFKKSKFYELGVVYANEKKIVSYESVKSIEDLGVRNKNIEYKVLSGSGEETKIFETGEGLIREGIKGTGREISVSDIDYNIVRNALAKNEFFNFDSLNKFIPELKSIRQFIEEKKYLAGFKINFLIDEYLPDINRENKFNAILKLLCEIEKQIKESQTQFKGTKKFIPYKFKDKFIDKKIKVQKGSERENGQVEFLENKDWYVFNANFGTSEEKEFVKLIDRQIDELSKKYDKVYLVRNERQLKIYNFKDGQAFEPDYLLFLINKNGDSLTYQLFMEPKGKYLAEGEKWKNNFLEEIKNEAEVVQFSESRKYRVLGVPFYNSEDENNFKEKLFEIIK
jgi:type III restriction enzyme